MTVPDVTWIEPGAPVIEVRYLGDPYRQLGRRATVTKVTATQIVLNNDSRYRIATMVGDPSNGTAQFSRPDGKSRSARVQLLAPTDPRLKDVTIR